MLKIKFKKQLSISHLYSCIVCLIVFNAASQDNFNNYTTKDGLPSNQVYDIFQDDYGIMWFATDRGLSSFNGTFFINYTTLDGLLSDVIYDFYPQKDGTVWCSTNKIEFFILDPLNVTFTPFRLNHLLPDDWEREVKSMLIDGDDYYFRFKGKSGYLKLSSNGVASPFELVVNDLSERKYYLKHLKADFYYYSSSASGSINKGPIDVSYRDMIVENGSKIARINYNYLEILSQNERVKKIKLLESGELLEIGTIDSLFWITGYNIGAKLINRSGEIVKTYHPELPCSGLFKDREGGVWISTLSNGVFHSPANDIRMLEYAKNEHITSLSTSGNMLAFGTHSGKVVAYSLVNDNAKVDKSSSKGLVNYYKGELYSNILGQKSEVLNSFIRKISDDPTKALVLATAHSCWHIGNQELLYLSEEECHDIEPLNNNFIISEGTGIRLIDSKGKVINHIDLKTKILDVDVSGNRIYCATSSRGLLILNFNLKLVDVIDFQSGLKSNYVNEVLIRKEIVWLGTRNGVSRVEFNRGGKTNVSTVGVLNGLTDNEVTDLDFVGDTLFLGTRSGVNYLNVSNWNKIIHSSASIYFRIKNISQQGQELKSTDDLSYYQNDITVEIELATYNINREILFRYKLEGLDDDWSITRSRMLNFKSLPPGEYELLIQANINDSWNDKILRQKIVIYPAWYTTWWFIVSVTCIVAFVVWLFFKYRILNYNREIIREILRQTLKRVKKSENIFVVRSNGSDIKIASENVLFVESSRNYITIYTVHNKVIIREKISEFLNLVPDPIEYIQIKRSIIVRIDQVKSKSKDTILIGDQEIKVGTTYMENLKKIHF